MKILHRIVLCLAALLLTLPCSGQLFQQFRPMYFVGGIPLDGPVNKSTANLKFQFSMAIPIWQGKGKAEGMAVRQSTQKGSWEIPRLLVMGPWDMASATSSAKARLWLRWAFCIRLKII